jgi:uncharacterized protein (DUF2336 family)
MIMRHFLSWAQTANAAQRAEAAGALARAYLYADLDSSQRREAELTLTSLAEDSSPLVRRALAENLASAVDAPRALVSALACDQSDVASPILSRSPLLSDAELIDCAAIGDVFAQTAIALRARVPSSVCAALAEIGAREASISLAVNPGAEITAFSLCRMVERFGDDGEMREALLSRPWLPATVRNALVNAAAASLSAFVVDCGWLTQARAERLSQEERDKANVVIVADAAEQDGRRGVRELVQHLCASGQLTASLVLRALLSGNRDLFEATLTELSGLREEKVAGLLRDFRGAGFAALYARAGLPEKFLPAFRAALEAQRDHAMAPHSDARLSLVLIEHVLAACAAIDNGELDRLKALLRRFQREAALEQARLETARLAAQADIPEVMPAVAIAGTQARAPLIDLDAFDAELREAA